MFVYNTSQYRISMTFFYISVTQSKQSLASPFCRVSAEVSNNYHTCARFPVHWAFQNHE